MIEVIEVEGTWAQTDDTLLLHDNYNYIRKTALCNVVFLICMFRTLLVQ